MADTSKTNGTIDLSKLDTSIFYFSSGRGDGWAGKLLRSLEVDKPVIVEYPAETKKESALSGLSQAAKRMGIKIAIRTVDGVPVVMRLKTAEKEPAAATA